MKYLIGIDIGTSSSKVVAATPAGEVLAVAGRPHRMLQPKTGWREQDPEEIYQAVMAATAEVVGKMGGRQPLALSFSSAMHTLLPVDDAGDPIGKVIIWADQRSEKQARRLKGNGEGQQIYTATGTPIHPMSPLCKLIWMREEAPDVFKGAARFLSVKSFLLHRWFGDYLIDHSEASATGLFDIVQRSWYEPALKVAGITPPCLPAPVPTTHQLTDMRPEVRASLGLEPGVPVVIGASDGCLANLGSQVLSKGMAALTIGTSGAIRVGSRKPLVDPQGRLFNYILDEEFYIVGGAVNNGGYLLEWFRKKFAGEASLESLLDRAAKVPAGSGGLLCLPYFLGERAPVWDGRARGAFVGLNDKHGPSHLLRALLEGMCFNLFEVAALLEETGYFLKEIFASGGFTRSELWLQILTDIFDRPVFIDSSSDASAQGAVILALKALGRIDSLEQPERFQRSKASFQPSPKRAKEYQASFQIYRELYPRLRPVFEALAEQGEN